ncbi:uncharacterized protein FIBRA_02001 [Fibroporia radiculosa]|uniref:Early meiotic induction protein 1 n=1 Tax=Fibroporia radiculosa TaxID=599839 RepID=J4I8T6_9APHY|nr:uncharacterized protein FIBRA_02001 [Fibroporia radiculosa]CCL99976.1 predicted protein [Fibroporia radiculosa]
MSNIDFETAVKQEEAYLRRVHPTPEDIPACMKLFDDFLSCNILGVQFKSLYRYGHMSVCGHKLDEFKFCMSIKGLHPEEKRDAWIRRRAEWWARRRLEKSSEDIWDFRTEPLKDYPPARTDNSRPSATIG